MAIIQKTRTTSLFLLLFFFERGNICHLLVKTEVFVNSHFCLGCFLLVNANDFLLNRPDLLTSLVVVLSCRCLRMILKIFGLYLIVLGQIENR